MEDRNLQDESISTTESVRNVLHELSDEEFLLIIPVGMLQTDPLNSPRGQ